MSKIFISHSSDNNAAARAVAAWLKENGWGEYFLDVTSRQGLVPGERWQEALKSAADRCELVILLISPAWLDSKWCLAEFLLAKQLGKKIFGVLIEPIAQDNLPQEISAEWQLCDLVTGADRRAFKVPEESHVGTTEVSFALEGLDRLQMGLRKSGLDALTFPWPPAREPERSPYRGLKSFEPCDAAVFFGREVAITRGLDALRRIRERGIEGMFVILGASGAGKSSYLSAGLWPRLLRDDADFMPLPVIRPQGTPMTGSAGLIASLAQAFRDRKLGRSRADIRNALNSTDGFIQLLSQLQAVARMPAAVGNPPRRY